MRRSSQIEQLHEQASAATGLTDFGGDADGYLEGLTALVDAVGAEVRFNDVGQTMYQQMLLGGLIGRLLAQQGFKELPQCLDAPIVKPIIVTGFTRSGTTALHKLLSSAPSTQALNYWLGACPMPRPPRASWVANPLFQRVKDGLEQLYQLAPSLRRIHDMRADEPDEDRLVISQSFKNYALMGFLWAPSYGEWLVRSDRREAHARFRRVLQLIGYGNRSTWVLKDPMHLPCIDLLLQQFPDACIVHTCREPADVMPSVCSLMHTVASPFQAIDKPSFGRRIFADYAEQMDRFMALRRQLDPQRFLDVRYDDFTADPVDTARRIYRHFDINVDENGERALRQWHTQNTQHKHGRHEYTLAEFGLDAAEINERLSDYRRNYLGH